MNLNTDGTFKNVCEECDINFCTGKLLKTHVNIVHIGLSCEDCDQKFTLKRSLDLHVKNRASICCTESRKTFCNVKSLVCHKKNIHK